MKALEQVDNLYLRKNHIANSLKNEGRKLIGYLCYFAPPELITAAGMVPYRITGRLDDEITKANEYIEPLGCPYIRNCFEQGLKGNLDFLDGRIIPHSCDVAQRIYSMWKYYNKALYNYFLNVPHRVTPWSRAFFQRELVFLKQSLEKFSGHQISDDKLRDSIALYNENRALIGELYSLRKEHPPRLSGSRMLKILIAGTAMLPEDFNVLLKDLIVEFNNSHVVKDERPRILLWGCIIDDVRLFEIIENSGAWIVTDDTCIGTRTQLRQVNVLNGLMEGLTEAYFVQFNCPRTDRGPGIHRFQYVSDLVKEYNVHGVIGYTLSFCDPHKLDYADLRDYLDKHSIPMLLLDDDYSLRNVESIKTRVEAFIEILQPYK